MFCNKFYFALLGKKRIKINALKDSNLATIDSLQYNACYFEKKRFDAAFENSLK